jgi:MFS family permease
MSAAPQFEAATIEPQRVGPGFVVRYALASASTSMLFLAPAIVTLPLKVKDLVGEDRAPQVLALVVGVGAFLSMLANPFFGKLSDRTTSRLGRRRPWMLVGLCGGTVGILAVALAPTVPVVLVGWCIAQVLFNALLAALVAVLPDQVPSGQRGTVAGVLGVSVPVATVAGTFLVKVVAGHQLAMFLLPCVAGGGFIVAFAVTLHDRRLERARVPSWSLREVTDTYYVSPRAHPDFAWAFASRLLLVLAYAFLATYQTYFLLHELGTAEDDVPQQVFVGAAVQSVIVVACSLAGGWLSDRTGRRKVFVAAAALTYGSAMFVIAAASDFNGFLVGMALAGVGFGLYQAVDLALVVDVLPDRQRAAKDLGVLNIAGALPFSIAPAVAAGVLAVSSNNYAVLFAVAGVCALMGAVAIAPVKGVR